LAALGVFVAYLVAIAVIAYYGAKRCKTLTDFIAASGQLGFWTYTLLMIGAGVSGMSILGVAGVSFTYGWAQMWGDLGTIVVAISFGTILVGYKLWTLRKRYGIWDVQDYFAIRYEDPKLFRALAGIVSAACCFSYLIGQYTAIGVVSEVVLGLPYFVGSLIALIVIVGYVLTGGMFSTAWTTFLQSLLFIVGVFVMTPIIVSQMGGLERLNELLSQVPLLQQTVRGKDPGYLFAYFLDKPWAPPSVPFAGWTYLIGLYGIIVPFGLMVAPHIINNLTCFKDAKYMRWSPVIMYVVTALLTLCVTVIGIAARVAWAQGKLEIPTLTLSGGVKVSWSDMSFPTIAKALLPYGVYLLLLPVVLAAVMSTTDRLLVTAATNISYDVVRNALKPTISDRKIKLINWIVILAFGLGSWYLALTPQPMLAWFIWAANAIACNSFFWPVLGGLYWRRMNKHAARWGMIAGFVATLVSFAIWGTTIPIPGALIYAGVPGFIVHTVVTLIVAYATKPHSEDLLKSTLTGPFIRPR